MAKTPTKPKTSKADNFKGKGDHDGDGATGGTKAAAAPTAGFRTEPTRTNEVLHSSAPTPPEPASAPKATAKKKPTKRTGIPKPGETVTMHSPNPINGRMDVPAKVIRLNDGGATLALEVTYQRGTTRTFNSVGSEPVLGQQWWAWPDVDGAAAEA